ncbi:MAG: activator of HSP90 ATPase, partial [Flavobacteriaceae bacterium]
MPDFKKYFIIPATPEELYAALTFRPTIELWTGSPAVFTAEVGSEFSLWDDNISGNNRILEPGKLIEQEWYFGERDQPSIVRMKLHE